MDYDQQTAQTVINKALDAITLEDARVWLEETQAATSRLANNEITQNVAKDTVKFTVEASVGQKSARASSNDLSDKGIAALVRKAEAMAALSPEDPEHMPSLGATDYPAANCFATDTQSASPHIRAELLNEAVKIAQDKGCELAGSLATVTRNYAFGTKKGAFGFYPRTHAQLELSALKGDQSGYAAYGHESLSQIDIAGLAGVATDKAVAAEHPKTIDAKPMTVVLEPHAVSRFLQTLLGNLDRKKTDEGTSFASGKLGQKIFGDNFTLTSPLGHEELPVLPFDGNGQPQTQQTWVKDGVLENLFTSRYWAKEKKLTPTAGLGTFALAGGKGTTADLIKEVDHGILVTRFWYIRSVDPMESLYTGMTRAGTFEIKDGKISHALTNFRWNESHLKAFSHIKALGTPVRADQEGWRMLHVPMLVPPMVIDDFGFHSNTKF